MKQLCVFLTCLTLLDASGQSTLFKNGAQILIEAKDSIFEIENAVVASDEYDFLSNGMHRLSQLCLAKLKSTSRNHPDELQSSKTLTTLAQLATQAWRGSQYADKKKWAGIAKHFRRAFERSTSKFNYTQQVSFRLDLVDNKKKRFYFDKKPGISDLNLYKGKKPRGLTKKEKEELPDPIPLPIMTETQLIDQFVLQIKHRTIISDLKRGKYAFVGLYIHVDDNTLNKNKIPTARVVLVLGARRLRDIRLKKRYYVKE